MCNLDPSQRIGLVTRLRAQVDETRVFGSIQVLNGVNTRGVAFVTMIALRNVRDNEQWRSLRVRPCARAPILQRDTFDWSASYLGP